MSMLNPNENKNEALAVKALGKYGPSGLAGNLNMQNMKLGNELFKLPHTFTGFSGVDGLQNLPTPKAASASENEDEYAQGGIIKGPGTGTSDSIHKTLEVDGAIIPADVVKMYGKAYFDKLQAAAPKSKTDKGEVNAKVSDGEYMLSPEAVAYWGKDAINKLIGSDKEEGESGYADGGIVNNGLQQRINDVIARGNTGVSPEVTPTLQDRMPAAQANAQVQNDALRAKMNAPEPSLGLRDRMDMPPVQTPPTLQDRLVTSQAGAQANNETFRNRPMPEAAPTLQQRMPGAQANMQGQNKVMRNNGFGANRMVPSLAPSAMPRTLSATSVDANTVGNVANDLVSNYDYQHPELKSKMQAMFPKPGYAHGGIIDEENLPQSKLRSVKSNIHNIADTQTFIPELTQRDQSQQVQIPNSNMLAGRRTGGERANYATVVNPNVDSSIPELTQQASRPVGGVTTPEGTGTVKVPSPGQQLSNLATGRDAGLEPVGASASGATLTRPRTLQDVAQNKLDNENRNKWIAANAAREDALQAPVLQSGANQNNLLSDRAKILEQNLEFNRRQGALAANQQANSQPITAPVYDDTGAADRELAAKHGLEYAQLAQQQKQFDTTTRVGSATAETTANKPIYTAPQKTTDVMNNTTQTPGTVYDPRTGKIKYLNNEQEMPDISSYAPEQIKTRNENAQKILANMGNYDDTKVNDALKWMQYIKANSLGIK